MLQDSSDEMIRSLCHAKSLRIALVDEFVFAAGGVREVVVNVRAAARPVAEGLGHVRRNRSVFRRDLRGHHLEKRVAIGRGERLAVVEINFVLPVAVFVIGLVYAPSEGVAALGDLLEVARGLRQSLVVVARLAEAIHAGRIPWFDGSVRVLHDEEMLGLDADVEVISLAQPRPWRMRLRFCLGQYGCGLPSTKRSDAKRAVPGCQARGVYGLDVDAGHHVVRVRPWPIPHSAALAKPAPSSINVSKLSTGHIFDLCGAVNIHELSENEFDSVGFQPVPELVARCCHGILVLDFPEHSMRPQYTSNFYTTKVALNETLA